MNDIIKFVYYCRGCDGSGWVIEKRLTGYGINDVANYHTPCTACGRADREAETFSEYKAKTDAAIQGLKNARQIVRDDSGVFTDSERLFACEHLRKYGDQFDSSDTKECREKIERNPETKWRGPVAAVIAAAMGLTFVWACLVIIMSLS